MEGGTTEIELNMGRYLDGVDRLRLRDELGAGRGSDMVTGGLASGGWCCRA